MSKDFDGLSNAIAVLEREIERVKEIQRRTPPPHRVGLYAVEVEYELMLSEIKGEDISWKLKPQSEGSPYE